MDDFFGFLFTIAIVGGIGYGIWWVVAGRIGTGNQKIVQHWSHVIRDGANHADPFFERTREFILSRSAPGLTEGSLKIHELRDESLFSEKRRFLVVRHRGGVLKLYRIYLAVRSYGKECQVSWYIILQPNFWRRWLSRWATLPHFDPFALWERLSVFAHQDLDAHGTVVHSCVKDVLQATVEDLGQDFGKVNTRTSGVLELW